MQRCWLCLLCHVLLQYLKRGALDNERKLSHLPVEISRRHMSFVQMIRGTYKAGHTLRGLFAVTVLFTACAHANDSTTPPVEGSLKPASNFKECVQEGGKILKSYPAQCVSKAGVRFVDEGVKSPGPSCKDLCGDGVCQEIVCMAIGCPCSESHQSCPKDCKDGAF